MPSSLEKIIDYHVGRLRDKRPDVRLNAIAELEAMGADAITALPALETCHKESEEPEVKEAAQKAGYTIYTASKQAGG